MANGLIAAEMGSENPILLVMAGSVLRVVFMWASESVEASRASTNACAEVLR